MNRNAFGILSALILSSCLANKYSITEQAKCDGELQADEGDIVDGIFDKDGDGFVDGNNPDCQAAYDTSALDCNDLDENINPSVEEIVCDEVDNDCSAATPDSIDGDNDGVNSCLDCDDGDPNLLEGIGIDQDEDGVTACTDCNDDDVDVNPSMEEICDGKDNNCDGQIDEIADFDLDQDGFNQCLDCDDLDPQNHPGNVEVCDGKDNNCDGQIDEIANIDIDQDGFDACVDCDDNNPVNFPGNEEICDGFDNNCNGDIDESLDCDEMTDLDGTWLVIPSISYACAFNYVTLNVSALEIIEVNSNLLISGGSNGQPGQMSGNFTNGNVFAVMNHVSSGGVGCDETYTLSGEFISASEFTGVFTAQYAPAVTGACFDCTDQSFNITGVR